MKASDKSGGKDPNAIHTAAQACSLTSKSSNVVQLKDKQEKVRTSSSENSAIKQAIRYSKSLGW